jgi:hypothetical protein
MAQDEKLPWPIDRQDDPEFGREELNLSTDELKELDDAFERYLDQLEREKTPPGQEKAHEPPIDTADEP